MVFTVSKRVRCVSFNNAPKSRKLPRMINGREHAEAACVKGQVYVFGGYDGTMRKVASVEKYSPATGAWQQVALMCDERILFSLSSFMGGISVVGWHGVAGT